MKGRTEHEAKYTICQFDGEKNWVNLTHFLSLWLGRKWMQFYHSNWLIFTHFESIRLKKIAFVFFGTNQSLEKWGRRTQSSLQVLSFASSGLCTHRAGIRTHPRRYCAIHAQNCNISSCMQMSSSEVWVDRESWKWFPVQLSYFLK